MMYRVIAVVAAGLALGACSSSGLSLDGLTPGPVVDTVRFESEPPGAEAKTSNGQSCRTPCALALPTDAPLTVTFTLAGYQPESESLETVLQTGSAPSLRPNPVMVELTPAPPQPATKRGAKKGAPAAAKKPAATKRAPAPAARSSVPAAPAAAAAPAPAPAAAAPWPAPPRQ